MFFDKINWLAVLLCGVADMVVGFLWYSLLLKKAWLEALNKSKAEIAAMQKDVHTFYIINFITSLIMATALANILIAVNAETIKDGIYWSVLLWLGIAMVTRLKDVLFEKKPGRLFLINTSYNLAIIIVMGIILTVL